MRNGKAILLLISISILSFLTSCISSPKERGEEAPEKKPNVVKEQMIK